MQSWGEVSSIPGANTLFEGRQIKREETVIIEKTEIEETPR
jgi:hypothetical protein